jgi:hypothetical protein
MVSAVDLAAVPDVDHQDHEAVVFDTTQQAIAADAVAPDLAPVATQGFSLRAGIVAWGDSFT